MDQVTQKMTQEEAEQMTGMFNYSNTKEEVMSIELHMFKQFNKKDKHYHTVYEITSKYWINNRWKHIRSKGSTVLEAMGNYSNDLKAEGLS